MASAEIRTEAEVEINDESERLNGDLPETEGWEDDMSYDHNNSRKKRQREDDEEGSWTKYTNIKKANRRRRINSNQEEEMDKIEVCITSKDKTPKKMELAKYLKQENIGNIFKVKYVSPYKIFVLFDDEINAEKLITSKVFQEKGWKCYKSQIVSLSYGIIRDIELNVDIKDIQASISSDIEIVSIKRLFRKKSETSDWTESETVRLGFKGSSLPPFIYIYGMKVRVERYIFQVTQCSKCWRYGHSQKFCTSNKVICPKCTGYHNNCETTHFKCVNCLGRHTSFLRTCPVYLKERRIRELMAEFNCTYKRATTTYVPPSPAPSIDENNFPSFTTQEKPTKHPDADQPKQNTKTYAEATMPPSETHGSSKSNIHRTKKNVESRQRKKSRPGNTGMDWDISSDSEVSIQETPTSTNIPKEDCHPVNKRNKSSFKLLLEKLKNMIFARRMPLKDKIMQGCELIWDWAVTCVKDIISELPILKNIFVYG